MGIKAVEDKEKKNKKFLRINLYTIIPTLRI